MMPYLYVAIGASLGAMGRYKFTALVKHLIETKLPLATLLINWSGAFILAFLWGVQVPQFWYQFLGTGILGGFTTFSTLNSELAGLLYQRAVRVFVRYFLLTYVGGLLLAALGFVLGHKLV
ncbi:hypothetical protein FC83_GL002176 [Agrilactobacillus composti DSM 18527 = JCM 14202]|uniref:Fluoride-specific ion channel FluC n=1 Tax=Agrilactobacillus composti DSM 18527 = JCM 14202 TaxID=1423734 RepID=X0PVX8_9LACO|nr:fluoride efflux transporter CrcB [Agrilactobacillus composti]KRM34401.1 hypothetical protein FC83_GL002176 [Agrilactobacillus composti DSM 18527 = JCM 14202]GAF41686.1 CrcB protein [Agrilactobacillus composti DSM 18527 = JCM 14202]